MKNQISLLKIYRYQVGLLWFEDWQQRVEWTVRR